MSTAKQGEQSKSVWDQMEEESGAVSQQIDRNRPMEDGVHVVKVTGLTRREVGGDKHGIVELAVECVFSFGENRSKNLGNAGRADIIDWFLSSTDKESRIERTAKMNEGLAIILQEDPIKISKIKFDDQSKAVAGLHFVMNKKTSDKKKPNGDPWVNRYINERYVLSSDDLAWLNSAKPAREPGDDDVPF